MRNNKTFIKLATAIPVGIWIRDAKIIVLQTHQPKPRKQLITFLFFRCQIFVENGKNQKNLILKRQVPPGVHQILAGFRRRHRSGIGIRRAVVTKMRALVHHLVRAAVVLVHVPPDAAHGDEGLPRPPRRAITPGREDHPCGMGATRGSAATGSRGKTTFLLPLQILQLDLELFYALPLEIQLVLIRPSGHLKCFHLFKFNGQNIMLNLKE